MIHKFSSSGSFNQHFPTIPVSLIMFGITALKEDPWAITSLHQRSLNLLRGSRQPGIGRSLHWTGINYYLTCTAAGRTKPPYFSCELGQHLWLIICCLHQNWFGGVSQIDLPQTLQDRKPRQMHLPDMWNTGCPLHFHHSSQWAHHTGCQPSKPNKTGLSEMYNLPNQGFYPGTRLEVHRSNKPEVKNSNKFSIQPEMK